MPREKQWSPEPEATISAPEAVQPSYPYARVAPAASAYHSQVDGYDQAPKGRNWLWVGIAVAILQGVSLPPVELIQTAEGYMVRDGHHRLSVARAFDQEVIEAVIT